MLNLFVLYTENIYANSVLKKGKIVSNLFFLLKMKMKTCYLKMNSEQTRLTPGRTRGN